MICPRCGKVMVTRRCPCGYETRATFRAAEPRVVEPVVAVQPSSAETESETAKWRSQLERKFVPTRDKLADMEEAQRRVDEMFRPDIPGLKEKEAEARAVEPEQVEPLRPTAEASEPAEDETVGVESELSLPLKRPAQQELALEPLIAEVTRARVLPEEETQKAVSKEILLSRLLAGLLDLLLPAATAALFVFVTCWFLNLDFFSPSATYSWLSLALGLYFFNSIYFFWTAGRTPGMAATDVQLVAGDAEDPPFGSVLIRIVLFLPVAATLVGLLIALFDPECRTLYDRLSKTKVLPG